MILFIHCDSVTANFIALKVLAIQPSALKNVLIAIQIFAFFIRATKALNFTAIQPSALKNFAIALHAFDCFILVINSATNAESAANAAATILPRPIPAAPIPAAPAIIVGIILDGFLISLSLLRASSYARFFISSIAAVILPVSNLISFKTVNISLWPSTNLSKLPLIAAPPPSLPPPAPPPPRNPFIAPAPIMPRPPIPAVTAAAPPGTADAT